MEIAETSMEVTMVDFELVTATSPKWYESRATVFQQPYPLHRPVRAASAILECIGRRLYLCLLHPKPSEPPTHAVQLAAVDPNGRT